MKKKKRRFGSRQKGSGFEREIAKQIVRAFRYYRITPKDCFRTPLSGGHRMIAKEDPGDLLISKKLQEFFPFVVECKRTESFFLEQFLEPPPTKNTGHGAWSYLIQALTQARAQNRPPLLICRKNHCQAIAIFPENFHPLKVSDSPYKNFGFTFRFGLTVFSIYPWNSFLKRWVASQAWKKVK